MFRFHHEKPDLALYKVLYYARTHVRRTVGKWLCSLFSPFSIFPLLFLLSIFISKGEISFPFSPRPSSDVKGRGILWRQEPKVLLTHLPT